MDEVYIKVKNTTLEDIFINKDLVSIDEVLDKLENLNDEVIELKNKIKEKETEIENDYELKEFDPYDFYGVSREDFA